MQIAVLLLAYLLVGGSGFRARQLVLKTGMALIIVKYALKPELFMKQIHHKYLAYLENYAGMPHYDNHITDFVCFYIPKRKAERMKLKYGTRCYTVLWFRDNILLRFRIVKITKAHRKEKFVPESVSEERKLLKIIGKSIK